MQSNAPAKQHKLGTLIKNLHRIEDGILALLLFSMILLALAQILLRNLFGSGMVWADPLLRIMVLWLGLLGALAATRENRHISIDLISRYLSEKKSNILKTFTSLFSAIVTALLAYHSIRFVVIEYNDQTKVLDVMPAWIMELILPIAFCLITIRFCIHFIVGLISIIKPEQNNKETSGNDQ